MKVPRLHVGAGNRLGPLSIFPVWTSGSGGLGISTGTHADVAVTELASGAQVARLTVSQSQSPRGDRSARAVRAGFSTGSF